VGQAPLLAEWVRDVPALGE
jgi:hypothetical protein